jgi:hypothetical protein
MSSPAQPSNVIPVQTGIYKRSGFPLEFTLTKVGVGMTQDKARFPNLFSPRKSWIGNNILGALPTDKRNPGVKAILLSKIALKD